jgi:hypothetical protein
MSLAKDETLLTALDAHLRAKLLVDSGADTTDAFRNEVRTLNRLFDAALACGAPFETPDIVEWSSIRASEILCAA